MKIIVFTMAKHDGNIMMLLEELIKIPQVSRQELEKYEPHELINKKLNESKTKYIIFNVNLFALDELGIRRSRKRISLRTLKWILGNFLQTGVYIIQDTVVWDWKRRRTSYVVEIEDRVAIQMILKIIESNMESTIKRKNDIDKKVNLFHLVYLKKYYESLDKT